MIFIQQDVDQIVARAKDLGVGPGLTYKQGQFQLSNFNERSSFDLAMCLVNGWDLRNDLVKAFQATIEVLAPDHGGFSPDHYYAIVAQAKKLADKESTALPDQVPCSAGLLSALLVNEFLSNKYDLIYALQALIEHCATVGNHHALHRTSARRAGGELFPMLAAAVAAGSYGAPTFGGDSSFVPQTPEPEPDHQWYIARAEERRQIKEFKKAKQAISTYNGQQRAERARIRV